jgi:diacylglycerol kinase (ATP)
VVANGSHFGGGMHVAPGARPDDALFDVLVLEGTSRRALVSEILPRIYRGTHLRHPAIRHRRGSRVSVSSSTPFPFEVDGEAAGTTPVTLELLPAAVRVVFPT